MVTEKEIARKVPCPHCGKLIDVVQLTEVIQEPVKGEYERKVIIRKNPQTTLEINKEA